MERGFLTLRKKGFSLVTVLFLIVGISVTLGGVAFNFVTEGKLLKKNIDQNNSFYSAEIGLENAKAWIKNNFDNNTLPSSIIKIDTSQGAPQYCLKGYRIDELDVIKTEKKDISSIINTNKLINYSYEYFIENITDQYSYTDSKSLLYYHTHGSDEVIVLNKFNGKNAGPSFPEINIKSDGTNYLVTGWKGNFSPMYNIKNIAIDGDKIFILLQGSEPSRVVLVLNRITFKNINEIPKIQINGNNYSGYLIPSIERIGSPVTLFIDGEYLYYNAGKPFSNKNYLIGVVNKLTGELVQSFETKYWYVNYGGGRRVQISGIQVPHMQWDGQITINNDKLYMKKSDLNFVGVLNKFEGITNLPSNCPQNFYNDCAKGFYIYSNQNEIKHTIDNGAFIYDAVDVNGRYILIGIGNNSYRVRYIHKRYRTSYANVRGIHLQEAVTVNVNNFIDNEYIFANNDKKNILVYNKKTGMKAGAPFSSIEIGGSELSGYFVPKFHTYHSNIQLTGGTDANDDEVQQYFRIKVCGYDKKLNLVRLESIVAYHNVNKKVNQISWKELF